MPTPIKSYIFQWKLLGRKWRAEIYLDGHLVAKAIFSTRQAAEIWVSEQKIQLHQEVR